MAQWFSRRKKEVETGAPQAPAPEPQVESGPDPSSREEEVDLSSNKPQSSLLVKKSVWRRGLSRLRQAFNTPFERLFRGRPFSEEIFDELEEALLGADVGGQTTAELIARLREHCRRKRPTEASVLKDYLKEEMLAVLQKLPNPPLVGETRPWVILVVGVNGVGKTTTIAKLAARFCQEQKTVLLVAADTFRAAAIEQLEVWAERLGVELIKHRSGASPAAVAFDGIKAALARRVAVVIIDTAGRLHTKTPLMEELKKVQRVIARELPGAPHETLLVLDAATGQNALSQAQTFQQALSLTGVILAKMDGSAKGGVALSVAGRLGVPIRCVGLGEQAEDLQDFAAADFVEALFAPVEGAESEIYLDREMPGQ
ncbi:MAG: signal recognition particle-docking protein FtsY [Deltaproteobacteria bacterium]|nr:signal recognition particle-docking protein FtsY [Deltaproteobacteria bacterium]